MKNERKKKKNVDKIKNSVRIFGILTKRQTVCELSAYVAFNKKRHTVLGTERVVAEGQEGRAG